MKRILSLIVILALVLSLFTLGVMAADVTTMDEVIDDEFGWEHEEEYYFDEQILFIVVIVLVALLGIAVPIIPITISLVQLFYKGAKHPIPYYTMFIASVIWLLLGIIVMILILL